MDVKKQILIFLLVFALLGGCSKSDDKQKPSNGSPDGALQAKESSTNISGIAIKGPIRFGKVELFAMDQNGSGVLIGKTFTDSLNGTFAFEDLNYEAITGNLKLIVSEGNYEDETTGDNIVMQDGDIMLAMIPKITKGVTTTVNITPLTTMAASIAQKLPNGYSAANITGANRLIGQFYGIVDIISTTPINILKEGGKKGKTREEEDYGAILAGISWLGASMELVNPFGLVTALADDASDGIFDGKVNSTEITLEDQTLPKAAGYAGLVTAAGEFSNNLLRNASGGSLSSNLAQSLSASGGIVSSFSHPKLFSVSPRTGPASGGTTITITGRPILDGATLFIGGVQTEIISITHEISEDIITAVTIGNEIPKTAEIMVRNPDGQNGTLLGFTYVEAPEIKQISPANGSGWGGTNVTVSGTGFINGASVMIGDKKALAVEVINSETLTLKTPPGEGKNSIVVTNTDGQSNNSGMFTYLTAIEAPAGLNITAVSPQSGPPEGGITITIIGRGFDELTSVLINRQIMDDISVISENTITATLPVIEYSPLPLDVEVLNGTDSRRLNGAFRLVKTGGADTTFEIQGMGLPPDNDNSSNIVFADIDADGNADIIITNREGQNRIYKNENNTFTDATADFLPELIDDTIDVAVADINNDGFADLYFANNGADYLLINNQGGGFIDETVERMPVETDIYKQAIETDALFADFNEDGDQDLLLVYEGIQPRLYDNRNGIFVNITPFELPKSSGRAGIIADFTNNDKADIVVANASGGAYLLKDDLLDTSYPFLSSSNATSADSIDVDGDGNRDVMLGTTRGLRLYMGNGTGGFAESVQRLPQVYDIVKYVKFLDIDSEGRLDLLVVNNGQNRIYLNNDAGYFIDATANYLPRIETTETSADHWPKDGQVQMLAFTNNGQNRIYKRNVETNLFEDFTGNFPAETGLTKNIGLVDIDNDGDIDVLLGNDNSDVSRLYINDGAAGFSDETEKRFGLAPPAGSAADILLNDFNNDGYADLLIINDDAGQDRLLMNDKEGNFIDDTSYRLPHDSDDGKAAAVGDIDGDGSLDIVIAGESGNRILINDGTGYFSDETEGRLVNTDNNSAGVLLFDAENDGDLDILFINIDSNANSGLYINNSNGFFTKTSSVLDNAEGYAYNVTDINSDTKMDIITGETIFINEGELSWRETAGVDANKDLQTALISADLDGNGNMDLILTSGDLAIYLQQGDFTDILSPTLNNTNNAAAADFDNDGDLDIITANKGQSRLLTNTRF